MKIATFNANSIRARLDIILSWLETNQPDLLCIQETKVTDAEFPSLPFIENGYNVVFRGQKSYNGVALISKDKPSAVSFGFSDDGPPDDTRLLYARFGPVHIINTYVPQGRDITHEMYQYKLNWFKRLTQYFEANISTRMKVVWVGDLNVAPLPIDIHNSEKQKDHVCYHEDIRKAYADTLSWGFTDVFRKHHPEPGQYSFFDYRTKDVVKRNMGWRIDHILATPSMAKKSTDAWIDIEPRLAERPSDHTFMAATFDV
jgi:exodeoxyribonuclease-3